ncbi:MAG TPA: hypothetical protein VJ741_01640 [Solirubrobacteraceae bacterium]|nr:hypothetical protein [Solirubrobacteraceae bacterium]
MTTAIAESFTTDNLDLETLLELSRRTDPVGVLSVYLDARPGAVRASTIDIKNRLAELQRRLAGGDSPASADAAQHPRLAAEIERLTDPEAPGRGRVLFIAMAAGWVTRVSTQLPLPNRVVLDRAPFIHPMLELLDEGGPAGVVLATRTEARLLEWRLGELTQMLELRAEVIEPRHERSGPVGSRPASRFGTPTGAQRNARQRDHANRFAERVATAASRLAYDRGWERLLVSAGEHQTDSLVRALPPALRDTAVRDPRVLAWVDSASLEEMVTERIRAAHDESERRLIAQLRERAQGAGAAALGLSEVVGALNQARVAHLIYDPVIRYRGSVGHDGSLYAEDETALTAGAMPDERLTERIVERALETGARVSPVEGAGGNGLADASGIAAVLRW